MTHIIIGDLSNEDADDNHIRLIIHGYNGDVLEKNVIYKHSYQVNGVQFIAYERVDGTTASVDAGRVAIVTQRQ